MRDKQQLKDAALEALCRLGFLLRSWLLFASLFPQNMQQQPTSSQTIRHRL
jgi:hypothetical protein